MNNIKDFYPTNRSDWRKWLGLNHQKEEAIWVIFYKKSSPKHNLSWSDSVDEALCFGWIDSTKRKIDNESFKQYFTKRKAKSNWSKVNKNKVNQLIEEGLMQEQGYKSIEVAKENGSWSALDKIEALVVPEDLNEEFNRHSKALAFFNTLSKSDKKILLYWVDSAKRTETRQKRIRELVDNANKKLKPKNFRA